MAILIKNNIENVHLKFDQDWWGLAEALVFSQNFIFIGYALGGIKQVINNSVIFTNYPNCIKGATLFTKLSLGNIDVCLCWNYDKKI